MIGLSGVNIGSLLFLAANKTLETVTWSRLSQPQAMIIAPAAARVSLFFVLRYLSVSSNPKLQNKINNGVLFRVNPFKYPFTPHKYTVWLCWACGKTVRIY